jgi:hypothetical protein
LNAPPRRLRIGLIGPINPIRGSFCSVTSQALIYPRARLSLPSKRSGEVRLARRSFRESKRPGEVGRNFRLCFRTILNMEARPCSDCCDVKVGSSQRTGLLCVRPFINGQKGAKSVCSSFTSLRLCVSFFGAVASCWIVCLSALSLQAETNDVVSSATPEMRNLQQKSKLHSPVAQQGGWTETFGNSVAVDGDTLVVGAPNLMVNGQTLAGAAFVYIAPPGNQWRHSRCRLPVCDWGE